MLIMPGGGWRLTRPTHPALIVCRPAQAQRRRARTAGTEPILCRVAAVALPGLQGPCNQVLIYPLLRLKLPV
ncbi:TPA: hypothetical protein MIY62_11145 [Klebsiella pneumoniae]|nr:hypothetical protein [Klebsiella pneumoniae]PLN43807.1 hypothetical protein CWN71_13165 [Klebsiella pneumoniae]TXU21246.1 hypothetical protein D4N02_20585 [Klebsiella pneumoniae]HBY0223540.1 hypothetical protein [Klebsiella pneumoniae]HBY0241280.1 hypothetical protein [Klebsiella pneumoniae]